MQFLIHKKIPNWICFPQFNIWATRMLVTSKPQ